MIPCVTFSPRNTTNPIVRVREDGTAKTQKELSNEILKVWKHRTISTAEMATAVFSTDKPTRTQMVRASFLLCKAMEANLVERIERGIYRVLTQNLDTAPKMTEEHIVLDQFLTLGRKYKKKQKFYLSLTKESDELTARLENLNHQSNKVSEQLNDIDTEMLALRKRLDALLNDA